MFEIDPIINAASVWPKVNGLTCPDWGMIADWADQNVSKCDLHLVYMRLSKHWLKLVADEFGPAYRLLEQDDFQVITSESESDTLALVNHAKHSIQCSLELLPGVAFDEGYGAQVMILAGDDDTYYRYLDAYQMKDEPGHEGASAGMCINEGFVHILLSKIEDWYRRHTITHEFTHVILSHLQLPLWVEEGVVQLVTSAVEGEGVDEVDINDIERQQEFWSENSMAEFWSGESFYRPDDGQELSYKLAVWMVYDLLRADRDAFLEALKTLDGIDDPTRAMCDHLGIHPVDTLPPFLRPYR